MAVCLHPLSRSGFKEHSKPMMVLHLTLTFTLLGKLYRWIALRGIYNAIDSLQEMETNTEAYIRYDPAKENAWVKAIIESLKDGGKDYYRVESKQLVTMLMIVIAKKSHRPFISEVTSTYAGVGLMNMMVNTKKVHTVPLLTKHCRAIRVVSLFVCDFTIVISALSRAI